MKILTTYLGHESNIVTYIDGKITIFELDKLLGEKWTKVATKPVVEICNIFEQVFDIIGTNSFDLWVNGSIGDEGNGNGDVWATKFKKIIDYKRHINGPGHHLCHGYSSFYQSPFEKAFIISSDGGGNDGVFNMYRADRQNGLQLFQRIDRFDFGTFYALLGCSSKEITDTTGHYLDIAGKAMALASVGHDRSRDAKLRNFIQDIYTGQPFGNFNAYVGLNKQAHNVNVAVGNHVKAKFQSIEDNSLSRQICEINQTQLENKFHSIVNDRSYEIFSRYDGNLVLTGGVAMNVVNNQKLRDKQGVDLFVPCNPSDRGLALGLLYWYLHLTGMEIPRGSQHYAGPPLIADGPIDPSKRKTSIKTIANMLKKGAILGVAEGNGEIGMRALGRRSIICDPSIPGMKDKINAEVKGREWFRPFAPIVLEEHLDGFKSSSFDNLEYMAYAVPVTDEFAEKYPAVCHVDNTARVQLCDDENSTVYKIMKELGTPLLNTSFNIQGQPIIARESEAFDMLNSGVLDGIVVNGVLYKKPKSDK